jgi:hypothetical protein
MHPLRGGYNVYWFAFGWVAALFILEELSAVTELAIQPSAGFWAHQALAVLSVGRFLVGITLMGLVKAGAISAWLSRECSRW